ncbi:MAG: hypothetical protein ABJL44_08165 [Algibacter sp.]
MKRKKIKYLIETFLIVIIVFATYMNTTSYIQDKTWKYGEGAHIGDFLEFRKNEVLKSRIIYRDKKQIGKIIFCFGKYLIIKNYNTSKKGFYIHKEIGNGSN